MSKLNTIRVTIVALALAALAFPAGAAAIPHPHVSQMLLDVQVTGTHTDDWHVTEGPYPEPDRPWVDSTGKQTLSFRSPKVRYLATAISGSLPGGVTAAPLSLVPKGGLAKPFAATLTRQASWKREDAPLCDREGGCEGDFPLYPLRHNPECPDQTIPFAPYMETVWTAGHGSKMSLRLKFPEVSSSGLWPNCPPDMDGTTRALYLEQPEELAFGGAIKQIVHMAKGDSLSFKASATQGAVGGAVTPLPCPTLGGPIQQECAVTKATVEVTRVR
jgi:hypothetical protein